MVAKRWNSRPRVSLNVGLVAKAGGEPMPGHTQLQGDIVGICKVLLDDPLHSLVGRSEDGGTTRKTEYVLLARSELVRSLTDEGG